MTESVARHEAKQKLNCKADFILHAVEFDLQIPSET